MKFWIPLTFILGLLNIILLHQLTISSQKTIFASEETQLFRLKMNKAYFILGIVVIGLGGIFGTIGLIKKGSDTATLIIVTSIFLLCLMTGFGTILYFRT